MRIRTITKSVKVARAQLMTIRTEELHKYLVEQAWPGALLNNTSSSQMVEDPDYTMYKVMADLPLNASTGEK